MTNYFTLVFTFNMALQFFAFFSMPILNFIFIATKKLLGNRKYVFITKTAVFVNVIIFKILNFEIFDWYAEKNRFKT